ncbi:MAG: DMT family transporter [Sphingomonas bacterium]|nr:DMT family transporter [Sphingomonas bacterium]
MTYTGVGILLALLSSITTAAAHALLKAGRDKLAVRAMIGIIGAVVLAPVCLVVPLPTSDLLPWLLTASALHTTYQLVLVRAYAAEAFSVTYPIARGVVPITTAILGIMLLGDTVSLGSVMGICLVSAGMMAIVIGRAISAVGLIAAGVAGFLTTSYTVVDAHAIRLAPAAVTFIAWFFLLDGIIMFPIFAVVRRGRVAALLQAEWRHGTLAGAMSLVSFGSALIALRLAPVGVVSGVRETSVVFGMLIAALGLHEKVDRRQVSATAVIAGGAIMILASSA